MSRSIAAVFSFAALCAALWLTVRFLIVEPEGMEFRCIAEPGTWQCIFRNAAVYGFSRGVFGYLSLIAAALAAVGALRLFAAIAILSGMAGVIMYDFDTSAIGLLAGALLLLRFNWKARQRKQQGESGPAQRIAIG